ncbi:MAG: Nudix family hydrolase [Ahniella sp.]|nr:Nudix family hydrolase [Ahniella sp.]
MTTAVEPLQVVAGIIGDDRGQVLIARRPQHKHHGGLWEFPGGKQDPGEQPDAALARELHEELGVQVRQSVPWCVIRESRPDRPLALATRRVLAYDGAPKALEHEALAWVLPACLHDYDLAPADRRIAQALAWPKELAISPGPETVAPNDWPQLIDRAIARGAGRIHLRSGATAWSEHVGLAETIAAIVRDAGLGLAVHDQPQLAERLRANVLHWSERAAASLTAESARAAAPLIGLSVHAGTDPARVAHLSPDYLLIGNLKATASHVGRPGMGWSGFRAIADRFDAPAYAIGGLGPDDGLDAFRNGALGIASISAYFG